VTRAKQRRCRSSADLLAPAAAIDSALALMKPEDKAFVLAARRSAKHLRVALQAMADERIP
jgi:hypothetical protein